MDLETKIINDIRKIVKKYESKNPSIELLQNVIEVLNQDSLFSGILNLEHTNKNIVLYTETHKKYVGNIKVNYKNMLKDLNRHINVFLDSANYKKLVVYFSLFYILHECSHVLQCLWAYNDKNEYQQINEIYQVMIEKMNNSKYVEFIYNLNRYKFFNERNANLLALEILKQIYKDNNKILIINSEYFLYNLFDLYDFKNRRSPIEITFGLMRQKEFVETSNLPFSELIKQGFRMTEKQWNQFKELFEIYKSSCEASVIEKEIQKRIRQL